MKKIICILLIIVYLFGLTSCYSDLEKNSLDEYINCIKKNECGFSSTGIDDPKYFIPYISFLDDYQYIEGGYYWHEEDPIKGCFGKKMSPEIAILYLKYDSDVYCSAKKSMMENIKSYSDNLYIYNDYTFYENFNHSRFDDIDETFPKDFFMMSCYNDEKYILMFISCYSGTIEGSSCLEDKYVENINDNWDDFLEEYYGQYYDFSK